jgi:hypothetical protein
MQAVTGTETGDVIVWEESAGSADAGDRSRGPRFAAKVISLHTSAIRALVPTRTSLVTGGADGCVRFFDPRLRLTAWFEVWACALTPPAYFWPAHLCNCQPQGWGPTVQPCCLSPCHHVDILEHSRAPSFPIPHILSLRQSRGTPASSPYRCTVDIT